MSAADMQLVRDNVPGVINLAVGEPYFLQELYKNFYPHRFNGPVTYPSLSGDPTLADLLRERHPGKKIVITNGAKQGLLAACHALREIERKTYLAHEAPYWPTYPTIASLSKMDFLELEHSKGSGAHVARVLTSPNNPDGSQHTWPRKWDIWDAAYASPIYGWNGVEPEARFSVYSAAKLYGVSGYRIGWITTDSQFLAGAAATYVEQTTSGVAMPSQQFLAALMMAVEGQPKALQDDLVSQARDALFRNSELLRKLYKYFAQVSGFPVLGEGMFAWVRASQPEHFKALLAKAKVRVVGGEFCGGGADWFRISLGVPSSVMEAAVLAIQEADDGSAQ